MSLTLEHVTFEYNTSRERKSARHSDALFSGVALRDVSLSVEPGEFFGIIGHTGSGKSTLLQLMNGLLLPTAGEVTVDGLNTKSKEDRRRLRFTVGLVLQYPESQLFEETVLKDVAFGPRNMGLSEEEAEREAKKALELVGLDPAKFSARSPFELSGGEKRRVALAGILSMEPKYIALDEPMAGLDPRGRKEILSLLERLRRERNCAVLMVSHSMEDIAEHAGRIAVLKNGSLAALGTAPEIFLNPSLGLPVPGRVQLLNLLENKGLHPQPEGLTLQAVAGAIADAIDGKGGTAL